MSKVDRIRGSIDVPLDAEGREDAEKVGEMFARAGGIDVIICSSLKRARQTAQIIHKLNPGSLEPTDTSDLHPWHLGNYEGQDTSIVIPKILELAEKHPDEKAPGKAPNGTEKGESFNHFEDRVLDFMEDLWTFWTEHPEKYVVVTHLRDVKLIEAALTAGGLKKRRFPIDSMKEIGSKEDPGAVLRLTKDRLVPVKNDPKAKAIYMVRHGSTAMNGGKGTS